MSFHGLITTGLLVLVVVLWLALATVIKRVEDIDKRFDTIWFNHHAAVGAQKHTEDRVSALEAKVGITKTTTGFPPKTTYH